LSAYQNFTPGHWRSLQNQELPRGGDDEESAPDDDGDGSIDDSLAGMKDMLLKSKKLYGLDENSPRCCQFYSPFVATVCFLLGFFAVVDTVWVDGPHVQTHPGENLPSLQFVQKNRTIYHSVQSTGTLDTQVFGETCCNEDADLGDTTEKWGNPRRFGQQSFVFLPDLSVVIQFPRAKVRRADNVSATKLTLEHAASLWTPIVGNAFKGDTVSDCRVEIRAESSAHSYYAMFVSNLYPYYPGYSCKNYDRRPLLHRSSSLIAHTLLTTQEKNNIASRVLTEAAVIWDIPPQLTQHDVIESPDLSALVTEIQLVEGWTEGATLTFVITPLPGYIGGREFKMIFTAWQAFLIGIDEILLYCMVCMVLPGIYFQLRHTK